MNSQQSYTSESTSWNLRLRTYNTEIHLIKLTCLHDELGALTPFQ